MHRNSNIIIFSSSISEQSGLVAEVTALLEGPVLQRQ